MTRKDASPRMPSAGNQDGQKHPEYVLSIDLGSGSLKTAIVAGTGKVMASAETPITTHLLPGGGAEQDPTEWWEGARRTACKVISESGLAPDDIVAVACGSQWSVAVPVDDHGDPLMRAIHWMDTRGGPYNRTIASGFPRIQGYGLFKLLKWLRLTGLAPTLSGVDSLGHVLFIKHAHPQIYARTYKFLEPMDFLTSRLTGRITATQKTMVPFVVMDNRRWGATAYSDALLQLAGLEKEKFPTLIANDGVVGPLAPSVADDLGLSPSTPVVAGISDSNASLIGSGAVRNFESIIYIGTSLYMTCHLPFKKTDLAHFMTALPSPFRNRYYLLGEQGAGGKCVEFYLKQLIYPDDAFATGPKPEDAYIRFNTMASEAPPGSGGVIFLPWLNGALVPHEAPHARGGFMNLALGTTRHHMARAIMEGLAYNNRWTRRPAEKFIGRPIDHFRFSGGGALSDAWAQIHADVLKIPILQVDDPVNTTVRGTAFLALLSLGHLALEDIPERVKIRRVFQPDPKNGPVYDKMYRQYRMLFKKNKKIFTALNAK
jgi:xylulokinase